MRARKRSFKCVCVNTIWQLADMPEYALDEYVVSALLEKLVLRTL